MPVTRATFRFFCMAVKKGDRPLFFLILAVAVRRQYIAAFGSSWTTRGASPTLPSPPGRDLLTLQTGSPDMSEATVLFADVSGSTRLIETQGDAVALKAIARCIERLRTAAESTGGQVVKTIGDEVMVLFPTPDAAVEAAAKMHASINALPAVGDTKLGVHVGFHSGPVIQVEKDVLGDTVKLAAKLVEQAQKGQTITSQQTAALLKGDDLALRRFGWIGFSDVRYAGSDVVQFSCG